MKTKIRYSSYEDLFAKQRIQLVRLCEEFQPYMPFEDVVFLEVVAAAREFCDHGSYPFCIRYGRFERLLMKKLNKIKAKYYINGIKPNNRQLTNRQFIYIHHKYIPRVRITFFEPLEGYRPVEKILFMKIVRACRDFMRAKMSKEAEPAFFEKLNVIYDAMA